MKNPYAGKQAETAAGRTLYMTQCGACHGPQGKGTGNIPSLLRGDARKASPGEIFWFITHGSISNGMPAFGNLPERQRWQLVSYVQSLSGASGAKARPQSSTQDPPKAQPASKAAPASDTNTGSPFTDYRGIQPGKIRKITVKDLPAPYATKSAANPPQVVPRPADAWPQAPSGFKVDLHASGFENPRLLRTAPNGDVFVAEMDPGNIKVMRGMTADGKAERIETFATGLDEPFGIQFYPPGPNPEWVYVANTDSIVRFHYQNGDLKARSAPQRLATLPGEGTGHSTRDIQFSLDGSKMWVSVGSKTNVDPPDENPAEKNRATILEFTPDGTGMRVYASGIRNAVGLAVHPKSGELWCSVNERDGLGDNLVPDYITHVEDGGFYGWPWYYIGSNQDPRHKGKHPELASKVIVPDVLLHPHNASLQLTFYDGKQFPSEYHGDIFAAQHGSWNKAVRVGYEVIRIPMHGSTRASGEYQDFITGFVTPDGQVWGRPVGVTVAKDGSLLISDDGSNSIWRVSYVGDKAGGSQ